MYNIGDHKSIRHCMTWWLLSLLAGSTLDPLLELPNLIATRATFHKQLLEDTKHLCLQKVDQMWLTDTWSEKQLHSK